MANTAIANAGNVYEARRRVMEELELIQYWEDEGNRGKTDPWAAFLRGTVCARADYIEDAVTFFKKTQQLGFIKGYEPHYRLASVLFRAGEVATSATAWDVGLQEANEMVGNLLHFGHTFAEKYAQFLPIWDGPPRALQQGICYYCVERYRDAERVLAGDLLVGSKDIGNFFFLKASMHKLDPKRATQADSYELQKVDSTSVEQLVHLYKEADRDEANKLFNEINESRKIGKDASNLAIPFYLALYMDSLGGNSELRDQLLDEVLDMDREGSEFLWYTARNRLSFSPSSNSPALSRPPHEVQRTLKGRL